LNIIKYYDSTYWVNSLQIMCFYNESFRFLRIRIRGKPRKTGVKPQGGEQQGRAGQRTYLLFRSVEAAGMKTFLTMPIYFIRKGGVRFRAGGSLPPDPSPALQGR
jgi:hypothetical protein